MLGLIKLNSNRRENLKIIACVFQSPCLAVECKNLYLVSILACNEDKFSCFIKPEKPRFFDHIGMAFFLELAIR